MSTHGRQLMKSSVLIKKSLKTRQLVQVQIFTRKDQVTELLKLLSVLMTHRPRAVAIQHLSRMTTSVFGLELLLIPMLLQVINSVQRMC